MAREEVEDFRTVVGPDGDLLLVAAHAREVQAPLKFLHIALDANFLPLFFDHFGDLRVINEGPRRCRDFEPEPSLAVGAQPVAVGIFLTKPHLVQERIGLGEIQGGPLVAPLRPGAVGQALVRRHGAGGP